MRVLVVGAGAVGGYFGGRLLEAGRDVTFLVRPRRALELAESGLRIRSRFGDASLPAPPTVVAEELHDAYGLVVLSSKAYDLDSAIRSFAPAVGKDTSILPLLNGLRHLDVLEDTFGPDHVLGGQCVIASTLNEKREVVHLNDVHGITFGERNGLMSDRVMAIDKLMDGCRFDHQASPVINQAMWEKWVFLATLAGSTCLLRAAVGDIAAAPGGSDFVLRLLAECRSIAAGNGYPPREPFLERSRSMLTAVGSPFTASMLRDIESGAPIEADHVIGDLIHRARENDDTPLLQIVYTALKSYEARRSRTA